MGLHGGYILNNRREWISRWKGFGIFVQLTRITLSSSPLRSYRGPPSSWCSRPTDGMPAHYQLWGCHCPKCECSPCWDCWIWRHDSCRRSPSTQSSVRSPRSLSYHWYNKLRLHTAWCSPLLQQLFTALSILSSSEQNDERDIISNFSWTKWLIQLMDRIPCWMIVHSFTQSNWSSWINFLVK